MTTVERIDAELERVRARLAELETARRVIAELIAEEPEHPAEIATDEPPLVRGRPDAWTDAKKAVLREHYPSGGVAKCREMLPHRSEAAIKVMCCAMGVKRRAIAKVVRRASPKPSRAQAIEQASREKPSSEFEEQLKRVERGEVGIEPAFRPSKQINGTLGGVTGEIV